MNQKLIIKALNNLELNTYEAKSYLSLLEKNNLSAVEVAKLSGVPRGRVYEALENLVLKGLCQSVSGDVKRYKAADPNVLRGKLESQAEAIEDKIDQVINQKKLELEELKTSSEEAIKSLTPLYEKNRNNDSPLDYIEIIKDPYQIHRKYIELYSKAQKEVLAFVKPPFAYASKEQFLEQTKVQFEAENRHVVSRAIIQMPPEDQAAEYFNFAKSKGKFESKDKKYNQVRIVDELPVKLFVFDDKTCFFTLEDPIKGITSMTMLVAEHEAMAKSFKLLFESFWANARDYYIINNKKYRLWDQTEITGNGGNPTI